MLKGIRIISTLTALVAFSTGLQGCGVRNSDNRSETTTPADSIYQSSLPQNIKELTRIISENNAGKFAGMVSYPLGRPYPLRNILNREEMVKYYPVIMDDSIRNIIGRTGPSGWSDVGWRGWTIGNGDYIWIDDKIYAIPYLSEEEKLEQSRLVNLDTLSLAKGLRNGWLPVECLRSLKQGKIYRIDHHPRHRSRDAYRLTVWDEKMPLRGMPSRSFVGHRQSEGTAGTVTYFFTGSDGSSAIYSPDVTDINEIQRVIISQPDDRIDTDSVINAYWLELLN